MPPLTFEELQALPTVVDLMTAARALGIGRTKAYQLAAAGQFPVRIIRVGSSYHSGSPKGPRRIIVDRRER